ncbi:N-acetylmuramidase domain-containing protein [Sphingomonas morindae]|uniref:N-acetylmuramidase domain-containing protein n=1 Tax=Sphingomonas morindae TaxID=1541170 RepID=A0ABY4XCN5_9SPHN|nr:N-acetylmuramidase domain-containing protein [Sphingomonas morindae]USI74739.1 N-acetylmuramidase domain-containing protein [Sphingomonas morindae]
MDRFTGHGTPLGQAALDEACATIGATPASLWALLAVETAGAGFQPDRRPKILFERHIFHRLTGGRFDAHDPDVSAPTAGGYGAGGAHQYVRLQAALQLDEDAALASASWGLGQILGLNHAKAGFESAAAMVEAFVASEDAQLAGMARFIAASGLRAAVTAKRWADYARIYNGADYARNRYDERLQLACAQFEARGCPDVVLRAAQLWLSYRGAETGGIDGIKGRLTISALKAFQKSAGLPQTGAPDAATLAALSGEAAPLAAAA